MSCHRNFFDAIQSQCFPCARRLGKHYIDRLDFWGDTGLIKAVREERPDMTKLILELGANTEIQGYFTHTALVWAALKSNSSIIKLLLQHNANPNVYTYERVTPFIIAIQSGKKQVLKDFITLCDLL